MGFHFISLKNLEAKIPHRVGTISVEAWICKSVDSSCQTEQAFGLTLLKRNIVSTKELSIDKMERIAKFIQGSNPLWSVEGARGVTIIVMEMDTATRIQILDETCCISHSTNAFGKGMNPIILPLAMSK